MVEADYGKVTPRLFAMEGHLKVMSAFDPKRTFVVWLAGITGCYLPRTRIHHYAIRALILCELGLEGRSDFVVRLSANFRPHGTLRQPVQSQVEIPQHRLGLCLQIPGINLLELGCPCSQRFQVALSLPRYQPSRTARTTCLRILAGRRQKAQHDIFG